MAIADHTYALSSMTAKTTSSYSEADNIGVESDGQETASVAMKVFGVPELLENILMKLVEHDHDEETEEQAKGQDKDEDQIDRQRPATSLFPIQRVCKAFRSTIAGSKSVKRLMFLEQEIPSSEEGKRLHSDDGQEDALVLDPLWWLGSLFGATCGAGSIEGNGQFAVEGAIGVTVLDWEDDLRDRMYEGMSEPCTELMLRPEASWRKMLLFRTTFPRDVDLRIVQTFHLRGSYGFDGNEFVTEEFRVRDCDTLGAFWDWFARVCLRRHSRELHEMESSWRGLVSEADAV